MDSQLEAQIPENLRAVDEVNIIDARRQRADLRRAPALQGRHLVLQVRNRSLHTTWVSPTKMLGVRLSDDLGFL